MNPQMFSQERLSANHKVDINLGKYGSIPLELYPSDILSANYISPNAKNSNARPIGVYQGFSADGGAVRLTVGDHFIYGFIEFNNETYWVEPARYFSETRVISDEMIVYRARDVLPDNDGHVCGTNELQEKSEKLIPSNESRSRQVGNCYTIELAIASDYSMYTKYNNSISEVEMHNIGVMNNVAANYVGEFDDDIQYEIVEQFISDCSSCDPWTSSTNIYMVLPSFRSWGQNNGFSVTFDLATLWSNRDFDGMTVGLAYLNAVCGNARYHVLQDYTADADRLRVLTAHEIGHNFSADHDGSSSPHIMAPFVQVTSSWSAQSKNEVSSFIDAIVTGGNNCLTTCTTVFPPVASFSASTNSLCLGGTVTFTDNSTNNPTAWSWTFQNGTPATSTQQNPTVTFNTVGNHDVTLVVTNGGGTDTEFANEFISVDEAPDASFTFLRDNNNVNFIRGGTGGACNWIFGDGSSTGNCNPTHTYAPNNTYTVSFTSTTGCGSETTTILLEVDDCPNIITLDGVIPTGAYTAGSRIDAEGVINVNRNVNFHAPNGINLEPGFDVKLGAVFNATPSGCVN